MAPTSGVSSERVVKTLSSTDTMSVNVFEPPASIPDDSDSRSFPRLTHILSAADSCHRALPVLQLIEVELPWFPASTAARLTHVSAKAYNNVVWQQQLEGWQRPVYRQSPGKNRLGCHVDYVLSPV